MSIIKDNQSNRELDSNQSNILNLNSNKPKPRASFKWVETLRNKRKSISSKISDNNNISIKKGLKIEEMIDNAKIHREANRPLKKIKEFTTELITDYVFGININCIDFFKLSFFFLFFIL